MSKQEEIEKAIKTCIAIEQSGGEFDGNRLTQKILKAEAILGVVIKVDTAKTPIFFGKEIIVDSKQLARIVSKVRDTYDKAGYIATIPLIGKGKG